MRLKSLREEKHVNEPYDHHYSREGRGAPMQHSRSLSSGGKHWSLRLLRQMKLTRVMGRREPHREGAPEIYNEVLLSLWLKMNLHM